MTWICYVGIEVSANLQKALLGVELGMLAVLSIWALTRVGLGTAPHGHLNIALAWFDPFKVKHFSDLVIGLADMLFIYWGWDTALNLNEETDNAAVTPGKAGVYSTFLLLVTYALVILADAGLRRHRHNRHRARQSQPHQRRPLHPWSGDLRSLDTRLDPRPPLVADGL